MQKRNGKEGKMKIYDWRRFGTFLAIILFLLAVALHCCSKKEIQEMPSGDVVVSDQVIEEVE